MRVQEILDMKPVEFSWLDDNRATFTVDDKLYGIFVDLLDLALIKRTISVANISFGCVESKRFDANDLNTSITNVGKPRTVLSTVASACLSNTAITSCDIIVLAASDQNKSKRTIIYSLALQEIRNKIPTYSKAKEFTIYTANESRVTVLSKVDLTDVEQKQITDELKISK